jgi:hypothetical protein
MLNVATHEIDMEVISLFQLDQRLFLQFILFLECYKSDCIMSFSFIQVK